LTDFHTIPKYQVSRKSAPVWSALLQTGMTKEIGAVCEYAN